MPHVPGRADHAAPTQPFAARARKFLVSVAGLLALLVASGVLNSPEHDSIRFWVQAVLAVLTAAGVYSVKNDQPPPR